MNKKILLTALLTVLLSNVNISYAEQGRNYQKYKSTFDSISSGAQIPIASQKDIRTQRIFSTNSKAGEIVSLSKNLLGSPVVWGGASPSGFDCSGLIEYIYKNVGITLPRTADLQYLVGEEILPENLLPGDLVYYTTYEPGASHVGVYIGDNQFVHTSYSRGVVAVSDVRNDYFVQRYYGAKRVLT